jgi:hypothetical protein
VVLVGSLLGLTGFNRYGESWDEQSSFQYGEDAVSHYAAPPQFWEEYGELRYYGPAYLSLAQSVSAHLRPLLPDWEVTDARHFVNHLTFQIATVALFYLCLRSMGAWPALGATLLFATQPVLFGHSFINQKDVPFMAGFLLAAFLGFKLGDQADGKGAGFSALFPQEWKHASTRRKVSLIGVAVLGAMVCLELLVFMDVIFPLTLDAVGDAYAGESLPLVNEWFMRVAHGASWLPLEAYLGKATTLYMWFRWPLAALATVPFLALAARTFRSSLLAWWSSAAGLTVLSLSGGAVAGLTTATRVLGFSVLGLVWLAVVLRRGWARIPALAVYTASAAVTCYAAWPYLHGAPLERLWESVTVMSRYPWGGDILYIGHIVHPDKLPWHYVPLLLGIQLTLPTVLLAVVGILFGTLRAVRIKDRMPEAVALMAWLAVPTVSVILLNSTLYGNFRQLLFITPPLFVFAGIALDLLFARLRSRAIRSLIVLAALAPGIIGILQVHPYEYVYYNELVGGVRGAFQSYELDYWCTSYREAMAWINDHAPPNAAVVVAQPVHVATSLARPDLKISLAEGFSDIGDRGPVFGLACGYGGTDLDFFPEEPIAAQVSVAGARLAVIRDLRQLREHHEEP